MLFVVAVLVLIVVAIFAYRARMRAKTRAAARVRFGKPCPNCGRHVHPAAAICKHCYARLPTSKA